MREQNEGNGKLQSPHQASEGPSFLKKLLTRTLNLCLLPSLPPLLELFSLPFVVGRLLTKLPKVEWWCGRAVIGRSICWRRS